MIYLPAKRGSARGAGVQKERIEDARVAQRRRGSSGLKSKEKRILKILKDIETTTRSKTTKRKDKKRGRS
jgi:hypothetical protein